MKYRKKTVMIEAKQFTEKSLWDERENGVRFWEGSGLAIMGTWNTKTRVIYDAYINITTLEGDVKARIGDWIIKGVNGEFYPCKPDIFEKTYEDVAEEVFGADTEKQKMFTLSEVDRQFERGFRIAVHEVKNFLWRKKREIPYMPDISGEIVDHCENFIRNVLRGIGEV